MTIKYFSILFAKEICARLHIKTNELLKLITQFLSVPHRICEKGSQVNIIWWNCKKARENPFQFLKVSTTWQLLSDYRGWQCQPNPKTPSRKPVATAEQFCTRIPQRRGMGSKWMNHQLNSLFRSREAAASLSQAVLPPPPNIFCM